MTKEEFETLTGKEVTEAKFNKILQVYLALPFMNKYTFCQNWQKIDNNPVVNELTEYIWELLNKIDIQRRQIKELIYK